MKTLKFAIPTALFMFIFGCGAVDTAIDCHGICTRYQSCYDKNYDTGACESRCRNRANSESDYKTKTDNCSSCLGNKDCLSSTFNCPSCLGIVP